MSLSQYFPIYDKLTKQEQDVLAAVATFRTAEKDVILHAGQGDCLGLLVMRSGQLRAYITSPEGREVTLYRLFEHDICLFSASCAMRSVMFDIMISVEKDAEFWVIPPHTYKKMMDQSAVMANYTNQLMASRFSDVMWMIEQVLWKSFDKRLAHFLIEESVLEETNVLKITHEKIAAHMGTAREVVTRMLKYFQTEGMVKLSRGTIELMDESELRKLSE